MKLLLDASMSWQLIVKLTAYVADCLHVDAIGLPLAATDTAICKYAVVQNCIIVTNDEDFINFLTVTGLPTKVVLLKAANQSTTYLAATLIKHLPDLELLHRSEEYRLLEIY
jgi:predicted nuclease of predicted toxin-antitoxin system